MKLSRTILEPLLLIALVLLIALLFFSASKLSFSYKEALLILNESNTFLSYFMSFWIDSFGTNSLIARLPFIFFYALSVILLYLLTQNYFTKEIDRFITTIIFALLPGINSSALIINESIIVVFCVLLYLYLYKLYNKPNLIILPFFLLIDNSFAIFYLALFFYGLYKKDNMLFVISLVLFGISMSIFGFDTGGKPKGHFVSTLAIYSSIFSPLLFLYFAYAMYKISFKGTKSLYWFISITAFGFSLLLSFRQKIDIADFAPFVIVAIPMMVKLFMHSYRVRLKKFRTYHKISVNIVLIVLVINFFFLHYNQILYLLLEKPTKHFAYDYHFAKDLAQELKQKGINNIYIDDEKLQKRLEIYGIKMGNSYYATSSKTKIYDEIVTIEVYNKTVIELFVTKLNN
ncbi:MAG: hypothetical protein M0P43_07235 [Arcobacteraceae bacterium]|jgi:hypothetical protein|nr:hypothetical protein [Arcobacteraceae bacterium]